MESYRLQPEQDINFHLDLLQHAIERWLNIELMVESKILKLGSAPTHPTMRGLEVIQKDLMLVIPSNLEISPRSGMEIHHAAQTILPARLTGPGNPKWAKSRELHLRSRKDPIQLQQDAFSAFATIRLDLSYLAIKVVYLHMLLPSMEC